MAVAVDNRVALYLQDKHPIREGMRYVQLAEECGFEAVWQAESPSPCVIEPETVGRTPAQTAQRSGIARNARAWCWSCWRLSSA